MTTETYAGKRPPMKEFVQQLVWREEDGTLVITPKDEQRFCIKINRAVDSLKIIAEREQFANQFQLLMRTVAQWISDRSDVGAAYVTLRDGGLSLLVVQKEIPFNDEFEDELSALDMSIAVDEDLELIHLTAISLPRASEDTIASFLDPVFTVQIVHGETSGSHSSGK